MRRVRGVLQDLRELLVVDDRLGLLALGDVGQLRAGERRVEEQRVRAELAAGQDRVDPPAVVAAHDRDAVAGLDAVVAAQARASALVRSSTSRKLSVPSSSMIAGSCGKLLRRGRVARGGRRAVAQQRAHGVPEPVRALGVDDPRPRERDEGVELRLGLRGKAS